MATGNLIIGIAVIILNILPFIFKKPRYLVLTGLVSVLLILLLKFVI